MSSFKILKNSTKSQARLGEIQTKHGVISTPFFMPDATRGVIKNLSSQDLELLGLQAMVVNTFHLYLQPGREKIKKSKGIHNFINWHKPLLSDSGGYQVFSLAHKNSKLGKILADRVKFKSPLDGSLHELTPEKSISIQFDLGTDMIVVFDDCPPNDSSDKEIKKSIEHTLNWAKKCKLEFNKQIKKRKLTGKNKPLLFGVIQGGQSIKLRKYCASELIKIGFDGYGFGARPVDANKNFLDKILSATANAIPQDKLRFGLGIGTPDDILACVKMGWDMFDCVIPTREARHGRLYFFTKDGLTGKFYKVININNSKFSKDFSIINKNSKVPELQKYTFAYLHHLFKVNENLAQRLATLNNLEFYLDMLEKMRYAIRSNKI